MRDLIIAAAAPAFILLIGVELLVGWLRGRTHYRFNDSLVSISLGMLSQVVGVFTAAIGLTAYAVTFQWAPFPLPGDAWWTWVLAIVLYDLVYYWMHRLGHEVNVLWANHVVHHSSEEYNLSTALRQPSTGFLTGWLFTWPLALLGIPPLVFAIAATANLLYQYWIHTQQIGRMGWFDRWFASPSNHRVHHGQNDYCLDRNFGGIFMIWDRLFGTFVDERAGEQIVYGIRGPLRSFSPLRANLHYYADLWRDCRLADSWGDRIRIWFKHPGWRPAAAERALPLQKPALEKFEKFDPQVPRGLSGYCLLQFILSLGMTVHFLVVNASAPRGPLYAYGALLALTLWCIGGMLEGRSRVARLEYLRLALLAGAAAGWGTVAEAAPLLPLIGVPAGAALSALWLWSLTRQGRVRQLAT